MYRGISSLTAKIYLSVVTVAGMIVFTICLAKTVVLPDTRWIYLALLTGVSSLFPVYLPRLRGKDRGVVLTISSIFIFTALLVFGPYVAAVLSTVEAGVSTLRSRSSINTLYKILFNLFHLPLATFAAGNIFYLIYPLPMPLDPLHNHNLTALFLALGFCSILYFIFNSGAISLAISLVTGQPFSLTWQQSFLSACLTNFAEASAAVVVFTNFHQTSLLAVGIAMPTAVVIYYAYNMNLARIHEAQSHVEEVNRLYHSTIEALAMAVDAKDQVTHGHIYRVQAMVLSLAKACGLKDENELEGLRAAALLHDIGKLATPDYILNKPGSLTDSEMETMKAHASMGADILSSVPFPYPVVPFVRHHHEKWDGSGYPDGLKGEEIPLGARVLAIVDCYDALRSDRPYRDSLSREAALNYIQSEASRSYDPAIVDQLVTNIDSMEAEVNRLERELELQPARTPVQPADEQDKQGLVNTVFHDIASAHREVQALHEISQAVGRLLNVSETLSLLADKIKQLVPYSACSIYLTTSNNETMVPYHTAGRCADQLSTVQVQIGEGVTGWVAANYRPLLNVSTTPEFKHHPELRSLLKACLAVPLMIDQSVVGVITLYAKQPNAFRPNDLRLIENIARPAATAISNAIVYEETQEDAYTDMLTGLPNLRYFNVFAEQELKRAERANYPVTILMMDLDRFKEINDELGHKAGDRVLIEIAHVLRNQMRQSDTCVRYGGDEFIGILPGVDRASSKKILEKIQQAVDGHPIVSNGGRAFHVGLSVGAATFPHDGKRLEQLLTIADQSMYRDKLGRSDSPSSNIVQFVKKAESA